MAGRKSFSRSSAATTFTTSTAPHQHHHQHHQHRHHPHHHSHRPKAYRVRFLSKLGSKHTARIGGSSRASRRRELQRQRCEWNPCTKKDEKYWRLDAIEHQFELQRMRQNKYCANCDKLGDHCTELCNVYSADDYCYVCGGDHRAIDCQHARCSACSMPHHKMHCQVAATSLFCTLCKRAGHLDLLCTSNWRMFASVTQRNDEMFTSSLITVQSTTTVSSVVDNSSPSSSTSTSPGETGTSSSSVRRFCPNCASNKHFYRDCPQLSVSTYRYGSDLPHTINVDERNQLFEQNLQMVRLSQPFVDANPRKRRASNSTFSKSPNSKKCC